jgi:hypothetical protein
MKIHTTFRIHPSQCSDHVVQFLASHLIEVISADLFGAAVDVGCVIENDSEVEAAAAADENLIACCCQWRWWHWKMLGDSAEEPAELATAWEATALVAGMKFGAIEQAAMKSPHVVPIGEWRVE